MGKPWLVNFGLKVTPVAIKWNLPLQKQLYAAPFFKQFVGGDIG